MSETEGSEALSLLIGHDEGGPYLVGGKCTSCQAVFFPLQSICPRCTERQIEETSLSRKGKLYTYTEVFQKPPDYDGPVPYLIGRVLLPEGVFVLSQLKGKKEELRINLEMELLVEPLEMGESDVSPLCYKFRPSAA